MWNLEKWYRWAYLQGRKRDTDVQSRHVDTAGEVDGGTNWESSTDMLTYTLTPVLSRSAVSDSPWPYQLKPARFLCPRDFTGKNTRVDCRSLLQRICLTEGLNPHLLRLQHWQVVFYHWATWEAHPGQPVYTLPCVKQTASGKLLHNTGSSAQCSAMTYRGGMGVGEREVQEGRDICICIADSFCCTAVQSCPTLYGPMHCSTPGFPLLHHLLKLAQTHVH